MRVRHVHTCKHAQARTCTLQAAAASSSHLVRAVQVARQHHRLLLRGMGHGQMCECTRVDLKRAALEVPALAATSACSARTAPANRAAGPQARWCSPYRAAARPPRARAHTAKVLHATRSHRLPPMPAAHLLQLLHVQCQRSVPALRLHAVVEAPKWQTAAAVRHVLHRAWHRAEQLAGTHMPGPHH